MADNHLITSIFTEFQKTLDEEQELREVIRTVCKEVDQISREAITVLQVIHHSEEGSKDWQSIALDKDRWKKLEEAFTRKGSTSVN